MFAWLSRLFGSTPPAPNWIEVDELRRQLVLARPPLVIDVRGPDEFDGPLGHIDGARNIPLPDLPAHQPQLAAESRPLVFVCLTDKRSSQAAAEIAATGARDVAVLRGGMKAWREPAA